MRIIGVIDLLNGLAVHAVRGRREKYRPLTSVLVAEPEVLIVARALREKLGLKEIYLADLDSIEGRGQHRDLIARLARHEPGLMVDAGVASVRAALDLLELGGHKVVVGSETLPNWEVLSAIGNNVPPERLVFSLDMRAGKVLHQQTRDGTDKFTESQVGRCPQLISRDPLQVLEKLQSRGWHEVILLDLARVGAATGVDRNLIAAARKRFPNLSLLVGGGIRNAQDMMELKELGVDGILTATALHRGLITRQDIDLLLSRG